MEGIRESWNHDVVLVYVSWWRLDCDDEKMRSETRPQGKNPRLTHDDKTQGMVRCRWWEELKKAHHHLQLTPPYITTTGFLMFYPEISFCRTHPLLLHLLLIDDFASPPKKNRHLNHRILQIIIMSPGDDADAVSNKWNISRGILIWLEFLFCSWFSQLKCATRKLMRKNTIGWIKSPHPLFIMSSDNDDDALSSSMIHSTVLCPFG